MYLRIFILCAVTLLYSGYITAQLKRSIYINDDVAQKFASGVMERDTSDYSFFRFLQYQTLSQQLIHTDEYERVYRLGVLLPVSSTISDTIHALASFGNETDSCLIDYQTLIRTVWQGRSAALSVLNAFSKPSERVHQSQPYTNIYNTGIRGLIFHKRDTSSFSQNIWYVRKKKPVGWLTGRYRLRG